LLRNACAKDFASGLYDRRDAPVFKTDVLCFEISELDILKASRLRETILKIPYGDLPLQRETEFGLSVSKLSEVVLLARVS
jgi:hypothetical protein